MSRLELLVNTFENCYSLESLLDILPSKNKGIDKVDEIRVSIKRIVQHYWK